MVSVKLLAVRMGGGAMVVYGPPDVALRLTLYRMGPVWAVQLRLTWPPDVAVAVRPAGAGGAERAR